MGRLARRFVLRRGVEDTENMLRRPRATNRGMEGGRGSSRRSTSEEDAARVRDPTPVGVIEGRRCDDRGAGPTDDVTLIAISQRDISANEEINVGLVLSEGLGFRARWKVRQHAALSLDLDRADRSYLADAASFLSATPPYSERVRSLAGKLSLQPRKQLTVDLGWRHERRSSLTRLGSYGADAASVGVRFAF